MALPVLVVEGAPDDWRRGDPLRQLEAEILPEYLARQRWFAGKARGLSMAKVADLASEPIGPHRFRPALIEVTYRDGVRHHYFLGLAITPAQEAGTFAGDPRWSIAELHVAGGRAILHDALADDASCAAMLDLLGSGREIATEAGGLIRGLPTDAFEAARGPDATPGPIRRSSAEQSNSAVIFGDRLILKVFRRPEPGVNPDFEIGRFLTERADFRPVPRTAGAIEYVRDGVETTTLAILQGLVPNDGSGWEHALEGLARFYDRAADRPAPAASGEPLIDRSRAEPPTEVREAMADALADAALLGRRTAEMHLALATDPDDPAFAPTPLGVAEMASLATEVREQVTSALAALRAKLGDLSGTTREQAARAVEAEQALLSRLDRLAAIEPASAGIRVHGDYHLGQVLRTDGDYVLLDFEGEPARSLAYRKQKQSPIKDVVGMLRSFDYAAFAGLFTATEGRPEAFDRLLPWARAWSDWTSAAFLHAYLKTAGDAPFLPRDRGVLAALLEAYTLDKALYELLYELNNRPGWVRIPLGGVVALLG